MAKLEVWKYKPIPEKKGMVTFDKMCSMKEFKDALVSYLANNWSFVHSEPTRLDQCFDYISENSDLDFYQPLPRLHRIYANVIQGGSEGYYHTIYAERRDEDNIRLFTLKSFGNVMHALELNYWLNRFLLEEIE